MKYPIVLVHGFFENSSVFKKMSKQLKSNGFKVYASLDLKPSLGSNGIEALAKQLKEYIEENIGKEQHFHLVGFSMGGVVSRYFLQSLDGYKYVKKFITIASPHHGTYLAYLLPLKSCQQLRPKSDFLNVLNQKNSVFENIETLSIWAKYDSMIIPNRSSELPTKRNLQLPFGIHFILHQNNFVINSVFEFLANDFL